MTLAEASATAAEIPAAVRALVPPDRVVELTLDPPVVVHGYREGSRNRRFEGLYGGIYNSVIQSRTMRRAAFSIWGSADPLSELDSFVSDAVQAVRAVSRAPILVDLPSGGGTLLPFLAREGFSGTVVEVDLAAAMLRRAVALQNTAAPGVRTIFLQADALDLPLKTAVADIVVSINGLHVVSNHRQFLAEIARVTRPGGKLWLITPVDGPSARSRAILALARALRITPVAPPTLAGLYGRLEEVGFTQFRSYGGTSIAGLSCVRA